MGEGKQRKKAEAEAQRSPQPPAPKQDWQHMVAGAIAGSSAVLLLHPFDVIKTRLQVQDGVQGALPSYKGATDAVKTILRTEGWRALYSGLSPAIIGSGVSWGAYLYLYERVKAWHRGWQGSDRLGAGWNLLSAAQAGAMVCLATNPIWLVKTRMALQRRATVPGVEPYRGLFDALVRIGREEGLRGYYKGIGPSLVLQTTHGAIQFAVYEELKALASSAAWHWSAGGWPSLRVPGPGDGGGGGGDGEARQLGSAEVSVYGALSKLTAAVSTYPTQVVRSRLQQRFEAGRPLVYRSAREAVVLTWQREGAGGFYKGLAPSLLRVMPQSAITLAVYEALLQWLSRGGGAGGADGQDKAQQQQQQARQRAAEQEAQQQQRRRRDAAARDGGDGQQRRRWPSLTEGMRPLVIAADSQAEQ
ncbi:folate transporter chloroplastic [Raphidocelis subcapitata]|uniref:Folate transporter chloroplastic n=1 Tax=Raphidocelis subcapitata TaxID=307507 RepID=A0A2V0P907_9CHLO|nr:folate transporter chloroplastic [Raphidocelis subcapitata]|eukprot:GBF94373.1 folate transporter chloroplastic [Raphidocelis subcapitata]